MSDNKVLDAYLRHAGFSANGDGYAEQKTTSRHGQHPRGDADEGPSDEPKAAPADEGPRGLKTTCLRGLKPKPVHWLVPNYLPLGKLVTLAGDGGHGKSSSTISVAACLTTGRCCMGLAYDNPVEGEVLMATCEDDFEDTVVPRLLAAGGDLSKVYRVDGVQTKAGSDQFDLSQVDALDEELERRPNVRLIIIDPAGAYVGRAKVDDHKDSDLRTVLDPLAQLAAKRNVTIIIVKHLNKGVSAKAVHKVGGSVGYVNAVRVAHLIAPDPDQEDRKLLLPLKCNLTRKPQGLAYQLVSLPEVEQRQILDTFASHLGAEDQARLGEQLFRVEWQGTVTMDADTALSEGAKKDRGPNKVEQAKDWMTEFLATYAYPSEEILVAGKAAGFTFDNIKEAKAELKADGLHNSKHGFQGVWWSGFGKPDAWRRRPEPGEVEDDDIEGFNRDFTPSPPPPGQSGEANSATPHIPPFPAFPLNGEAQEADEPSIVGKEGKGGIEGNGTSEAPQNGLAKKKAGSMSRAEAVEQGELLPLTGGESGGCFKDGLPVFATKELAAFFKATLLGGHATPERVMGILDDLLVSFRCGCHLNPEADVLKQDYVVTNFRSSSGNGVKGFRLQRIRSEAEGDYHVLRLPVESVKFLKRDKR